MSIVEEGPGEGSKEEKRATRTKASLLRTSEVELFFAKILPSQPFKHTPEDNPSEVDFDSVPLASCRRSLTRGIGIATLLATVSRLNTPMHIPGSLGVWHIFSSISKEDVTLNLSRSTMVDFPE